MEIVKGTVSAMAGHDFHPHIIVYERSHPVGAGALDEDGGIV